MQQIDLNQSAASLRRVLFVCTWPDARNQVQRIDLNDIAAGDSFTLTYSGQTTSSIAFNSFTSGNGASLIDSSLEALSNIGAGEVTVTRVGSTQVYLVTFSGTVAASDIALLTFASTTGFTPGLITDISGTPATGLTFATSDLSISKNGATAAVSAGTVNEIADGRYYYTATAGEVDTLGFLSLATLRTDIAMRYPTVQIVQPAQGATLLRSGTAQAGGPSTITLDASASAFSNFYVPSIVRLTAGAGAGQAPRYMYAYNGTSKVANIEPAWTVEPDNTTVFEVKGTPPLVVDVPRVNHTTADTFGDVATPEDVRDTILTDATAFAGANIAALVTAVDAVPTAAENAAGLLDLTAGVETGLTLRQAMRLLAAMASGEISGAATATVTVRNFGDTKNRIVATVDEDGNRSAITVDLT